MDIRVVVGALTLPAIASVISAFDLTVTEVPPVRVLAPRLTDDPACDASSVMSVAARLPPVVMTALLFVAVRLRVF